MGSFLSKLFLLARLELHLKILIYTSDCNVLRFYTGDLKVYSNPRVSQILAGQLATCIFKAVGYKLIQANAVLSCQ